MGFEVSRRDNQLSRKARLVLQQIHEESLAAQRKVEAEEDVAAARIDRRNANGYALANHVVMRATYLHHQITAASRDDTGLEMILRPLEEVLARAAAYNIQNYMT